MDKKSDLRTIQTKESIKKALYKLAEDKSFDEVSVTDITKKAMINRSTFYLHYRDKEDLLQSLCDETLHELKKYKSYLTKEAVFQCRRSGAPLPHLVPVLSYIEKNSDFFNTILKSSAKYSFFIDLSKEFIPRLKSLIPDFEPDETALIYGSGIMITSTGYIFSKWIKNDMKEDPVEIAALITKMLWAVVTISQK